MDDVLIYYAPWCGDCRVAKRIFDKQRIPYRMVDIEADLEAQRRVQEINGGYKRVPTIVFPSGTVVVEPTGPQLIAVLRDEGLTPPQTP